MNKPKTVVRAALVNQAIQLVQAARKQVLRQTNSVMVFTYFRLGKLIVESEQGGSTKAEYGKEIIKRLSERLTAEFGKGFSEDNLENMRGFFLTFKSRLKDLPISETVSRKLPAQTVKSSKKEKSETLSRKSFADVFPLSWSHYVILGRMQNKAERSFYEIEAVQGNWSIRELQRQFDCGLFERLTASKNKKKIKELATKGQIVEKPEDVLKTPYILDFLGLDAKAEYSEMDLETAIINQIEHFLLEMGKGFLFQGRQVRFSFDEEHFFVDLVLYNRLLQCFVLVDLKIGKLRHQDLGQMQMYVNYYDRYIKTEFEKPTVGIIICKDKSDAVVEITLPKDNDSIFAKQYKLYMPTKAELRRKLLGM